MNEEVAVPGAVNAPVEPVPAGFGRRAVAYTLDVLILQMLYGILSLVGFFGVGSGLTHAGVEWPSWELITQLTPFSILLWIVLFVLYFTFFHAMDGRTPAKRLLWIRVVSTADPTGALSTRQALLRTVGYLFSSAFLGFGFLMALIHPRRCALHDLLSGTVVVFEPPPLNPPFSPEGRRPG